MKKVKFRQPRSKTLYAVLCVGILAVGIASVAGYRAAVSSITDGLITEKDDGASNGIDYSAVDAILRDIEKDRADAQADVNAPADPADSADTDLPSADAQNPSVPDSEAIVDITNELEALYYQQAIMMPVNGEIISAYSDGELVKSSGGVWRTHDGIDIAAQEGETVKAMTSGTVTNVYNDPLWGCCVTVDHGNTLCGHYFGLAKELEVTVGDKLNAGDKIGTVGNTADIESELGSHLHFALKYENKWIDPISYIEPMK